MTKRKRNWTLTLPLIGVQLKFSRQKKNPLPVEEVRPLQEVIAPTPVVVEVVQEAKPAENQWLLMQKLHEGVGFISSSKKVTTPEVEEKKAEAVVPEKKNVDKRVKTVKNGVNLAFGLVIVIAGMFLMVYSSEGIFHRTSMRPLQRQAMEMKEEVSSVAPVASVSSAPVAIPYETYAKQSEMPSVLKQSLAAQASEDKRAAQVRQELGSLSNVYNYGEAEAKADVIRGNAKAQAQKLLSKHYRNEKAKAKAKDKAEKILAKAEKDANALLSDAEKKGKRINDLMAEQTINVKKEKLEKRRVEEIKKLPGHQALLVASLVKNRNVVYIENYTDNKLLTYSDVNGELTPETDNKPQNTLPFRFNSDEVCLRLVKVEADESTVINEQCQKFSGAVSYWVYDGVKVEKRDEPSPRLREALTLKERKEKEAQTRLFAQAQKGR